MLRFKIILRRYLDPSTYSRGRIQLFFPCKQDAIGELVEVGETRILEVALSEDDVAQLQHDYTQCDRSDAVKSFVSQQLRGDGSKHGCWMGVYNRFMVESVQQL